MYKSSTSNKFNRFIRPIVSGFLSALVAGICVAISFRVDSLLLIGIYLPIFIIDPHYFPLRVVTIIIFWFVVGLTVAYLARKNLMAVGLWLMLYIVILLIALGIMFTA